MFTNWIKHTVRLCRLKRKRKRKYYYAAGTPEPEPVLPSSPDKPVKDTTKDLSTEVSPPLHTPVPILLVHALWLGVMHL